MTGTMTHVTALAATLGLGLLHLALNPSGFDGAGRLLYGFNVLFLLVTMIGCNVLIWRDLLVEVPGE